MTRLGAVLPMGMTYLVIGGALESWRKAWIMRKLPLTDNHLRAIGLDTASRVLLFISASSLCRERGQQSMRTRGVLRTGDQAERWAFDRSVSRILGAGLAGSA